MTCPTCGTAADLHTLTCTDPIRRASYTDIATPRCDRCPARGALYEAWPSCRECGETLCQTCAGEWFGESDEAGKIPTCAGCDAERECDYTAEDAANDAADWAYDQQQEER